MEKSLHERIIEFVLLTIILWFSAFYIYHYLTNAIYIFLLCVILTLFFLLNAFFPLLCKKISKLCFKYRWIIAFCVFLTCICLRIHGSSIGVYDEVFPTQIQTAETTVFGRPRHIRSDEYGVTTPTFFSQQANEFRLYSTQKSIHPMNMVLDYYSPVVDWTVLGKPLSWGFLLFGNEIGLSWYWCGLQILLFMIAFETCLIITDFSRKISLLGALLIWLSPAIQWWIMPHMPILILYAMALFTIGYWFFTSETEWMKWFYTFTASITALGFSLSVFPSFQVPLVYFVVIMLCTCLVRDRHRICFSKMDFLRIFIALAVTLTILGRFLILSKDDLSLLLNTVYPGKRFETGGDRAISDLFTAMSSLFLPYEDITYLNNSEVSTYIHFAPLFLVLFPKIYRYLKQNHDRNLGSGIGLFCILGVMIVYMLLGVPSFIARFTLLSYCNRMVNVYGFVATLYTVWCFTILFKYPEIFTTTEKVLLPILSGIGFYFLSDENLHSYFNQFMIHNHSIGNLMFGLSITSMAILLLLAMFRRKYLLCCLTGIMMLFCGGTVNPIEIGISAITNHPIFKTMHETSTCNPDARWLCLDTPFYFSNYVAATGANVINATNFYPDNEKWNILDPSGTFETITNRYANETCVITDDQTHIELSAPDAIAIYLNPNELKKLKIQYLFSATDYTDLLSEYGISCKWMDGQNGYNIYQIDYSD